MTSVCSERFQLRDIDIPPRKYAHDDDSLLLAHKFLPSGSASDSDSDDPYSSDHFRMYEFKVRRCTRSRSHDWTDCPFAHPGEKARRRDPRRHHYSGAVCPEYRRGGCGRGDACEFAHGVFECWLHPARYRTEACKDGKQCKRKVCFFAHSPRQLRLLPENDHRHNTSVTTTAASSSNSHKKHQHQNQHQHRHHNILSSSNNNSKCCVFCSCPHHHRNSMSSSPTSTLLGPLSPLSYKDALTDYLMTSLEALHFSPSDASDATTLPFLLSPSTPTPTTSSLFSDSHQSQSQSLFAANNRYTAATNSVFHDDAAAAAYRLSATDHTTHASASNSDPDLGWVNDLLM